jgi:drug/metabolite transporter (DMT)-like permease
MAAHLRFVGHVSRRFLGAIAPTRGCFRLADELALFAGDHRHVEVISERRVSPDAVTAVRRRATLIGGLAVVMWATLATLTVSLKSIPPFQLLAMAFGIAFVVGSLWLLLTGGLKRFRLFVQPWSFWLSATTGLFAYHALYFVALRLAPAAEANLINYLWPLLIVLFSALVPGGGRLRSAQLWGAVMGLAGTALLIGRGGELGAATGSPWGYIAAAACALVWSSYSVLNRRFSGVPSEAMIGVCGVVAILGAITHLLFEPASVPLARGEWLSLFALGCGPIGLAFLVWDYGTKHGDLPVLGTLAYGAPILSTLLLVALGAAEPTITLLLAVALVVGGAWIATRKPRAQPTAATHGLSA